MGVEPITAGESFRDAYTRALKSGREQYMMNVSGYSLERVREDRKRLLAGYDVFGKSEVVADPEPWKRTRHNKRETATKPQAGGFAALLISRMNLAKITNLQLSKLSGVSPTYISDIKNGHKAGSDFAKIALLKALDHYDAMRVAFGVAAQ